MEQVARMAEQVLTRQPGVKNATVVLTGSNIDASRLAPILSGA